MSDTKEQAGSQEGTEHETDGQGVDPISQDLELEQYGENVRRRIAQETARRGAVERELAAYKQNFDKLNRAATAVFEENKQLKARSGESDKAILDNLFDKTASDMALAEGELRKAHEEADAEKIVEATKRLSVAAADHRRVELAKAGFRQDDGADRVQNEPRRPPPQPRRAVPQKAQEWLGRNTWYGQDREKTAVAQRIDNFVASMGYDPNSDAYYLEVDRMMNERFSPANGAPRDARQLSSATTPSGRSAPPVRPAAGNKVALSADEVAQAKRLGVSTEAYAAAKRANNVVI